MSTVRHRRFAAGCAAALLFVAVAPAARAQDADPAQPRLRQMVVESGDSEANVRVFFVGDEGHQVQIEPGRAQRGYLGVSLIDLTPELRAFFGAPGDRGVLVSHLDPDSPASAAGLAVGDVLTKIDGDPLTFAGLATLHIGNHEKGDVIRLETVRRKAPRTLEVTLDERDRQQVDLGYAFWSCAPGEECEGAHGDGVAAYRRVIPVAPGQLDEAVRELNRTLDTPEWKARMRRFEQSDESYEARLRRLEERIRELEEALAKAGKD